MMELGVLLLSVIALAHHAYAQPGEITDATLTFEYPYRPGHVNYPEHDLFAAGVHVHNVKNVVFRARGRNDAHVLLKRKRNDFSNNVVEIVIGGWHNKLSVIRDRQQGKPKAVFKGVVLSSEKFNTFWVSWEGTCIKVGVGYHVGIGVKMSWCGLTHQINYISASYGFGSGGDFQFLTTATELSYYSEFRHVGVDYPKHDLFADGIDIRYSNSIVFKTKGRNDAHVLLQRDRNQFTTHVIEIVIGGWRNTQSVIRDRQQGPHKDTHREEGILSPSEERYFWIRWENHCIKVGKGYSVGRSEIMSWCGVTHYIKYISASYGFGSDGYFEFIRTAGAP